MKRVLVDMDGVLADVYAQMFKLEFEETGIRPTEQEINGRLEGDAFPSFHKIVRSKGFFRNAPVMEGSVEGLRYLNEKYNVVIVSSATEFPDSMGEKYYWLTEHFPFISWRQMIFCGSKEGICGDIMIDDHIKNLSHFEGRRILFTQPQNVFVEDESMERVGSWKEIVGML